MSSLSQAKTLGGIGSILMLLGFVPAAGMVLVIVGLVLTLVAIKYISDTLADKSIFSNMVIAVVLAVAGAAVAFLVVLATFFSSVGLGAFMGGFGPQAAPAAAAGGILGMIFGVIAGLAVLWVLLILSALFVRKSYSAISAKLGVGMFGTAALLYLIGAALSIVLVGFVLIFVAEILNIVAFFSLPDSLPQTAQPAQGTQA